MLFKEKCRYLCLIFIFKIFTLHSFFNRKLNFIVFFLQIVFFFKYFNKIYFIAIIFYFNILIFNF